jgi:DNA-directed RNA polymerase specialized sigma24 family protein
LSLIEDEFINSAKDYLIQVSEQQAEVFMYKFYYDYSNEEIASLMGISHNYARVLVYRAKNNIKDFIEKWRIYEQKNIQ